MLEQECRQGVKALKELANVVAQVNPGLMKAVAINRCTVYFWQQGLGRWFYSYRKPDGDLIEGEVDARPLLQFLDKLYKQAHPQYGVDVFMLDEACFAHEDILKCGITTNHLGQKVLGFEFHNIDLLDLGNAHIVGKGLFGYTMISGSLSDEAIKFFTGFDERFAGLFDQFIYAIRLIERDGALVIEDLFRQIDYIDTCLLYELDEESPIKAMIDILPYVDGIVEPVRSLTWVRGVAKYQRVLRKKAPNGEWDYIIKH